jgi:5-oxoprolinase (ATP-hydrolysing)
MTVITPVYLNTDGERVSRSFTWAAVGTMPTWVASTPGSMPPFSTRIEEEGVQINNVKLVDPKDVLAAKSANAGSCWAVAQYPST